MRSRRAATVLVGLAVLLSACAQRNVFELATGTCFDDPGSGTEFTEVPIVECSEPHDNVVYAAFDMPDGGYPGSQAVGTAAEDGCLERFEAWAGVAYEASDYWASYFAPTEQSWQSLEDREVVCYAFDRDGQKLAGAAPR